MLDPFATAEVSVRRRRLPHWTLDGATYFLTFRLTAAVLSAPERQLVRDHIVTGHRRFYHLSAVVVMPDHVHLLLRPAAGYTLSRVMQGLKSKAAERLNAHRRTTGTVWQAESWDRIIRDEAEFEEKYTYMLNNPVKDGLAAEIGTDPGWWTDAGPGESVGQSEVGQAGVLPHGHRPPSVGQDSGLPEQSEADGHD